MKFDFAESPGPVVGRRGEQARTVVLNIAEISNRAANGQGIGGTLGSGLAQT